MGWHHICDLQKNAWHCQPVRWPGSLHQFMNLTVTSPGILRGSSVCLFVYFASLIAFRKGFSGLRNFVEATQI